MAGQMKMNNQELACVYASLILYDDGINITAEKIKALLDAAQVEVEPFWPSLYAKALEGVDVKQLISTISQGAVGSGPAVAAGSAPTAAAAVEAAAAPAGADVKKVEEKKDVASSSESEGGFGDLFD